MTPGTGAARRRAARGGPRRRPGRRTRRTGATRCLPTSETAAAVLANFVLAIRLRPYTRELCIIRAIPSECSSPGGDRGINVDRDHTRVALSDVCVPCVDSTRASRCTLHNTAGLPWPVSGPSGRGEGSPRRARPGPGWRPLDRDERGLPPLGGAKPREGSE